MTFKHEITEVPNFTHNPIRHFSVISQSRTDPCQFFMILQFSVSLVIDPRTLAGTDDPDQTCTVVHV